MPNFSESEENYIKHIYHLQQALGSVSTNALAASLQAKPASITDMLKKLKAKKLLQYEPYREFQLSTQGKKLAVNIIRKHRLWEYFLVKKLNFGWDEVHDLAEQLEHIDSRDLVDKLEAYLGFPEFDPHGDPIPDSNGKIVYQRQMNLTELPFHTTGEVTSVGNQTSELLEVLRDKQIEIGTKLQLIKKFAFDNSYEIKLKDQPAFNISEMLARALFVKIDEETNK